MPTSGIRDNYVVLPPPPVDHARSSTSYLTHIGGAAPAAPSCRVLGRENDQAFGCHSECLAVATAGRVCSQGNVINNVWWSVAVTLIFADPWGDWGHSEAPSGGRPCKRHHVALSPLLPSAHTRNSQPPLAYTRSTQSSIAQESVSSPPVACTRGDQPLRAWACAGIFLWKSAPPLLTLPNNGVLLLLWVQTSCIPSAMMFHSSAHSTLLSCLWHPVL